MPSHVWKAEITIDPVTYTGPTTGLDTTFTDFGIRYAFDAIDASGYTPTIELALINNGGLHTAREIHGNSTSGDPINTLAAHPGGIFNAAAGSMTAFTAGATLSITKDDSAATFTFQGPMGSTTITWASLSPGFTILPGELAPNDVALSAATVYTGTFPTVVGNAVTLAVPFREFWGSEDAVHIKGATLGTGDVGFWLSGPPFDGPPLYWSIHNTGTTMTEPSTGTAIVGQIAAPATATIGRMTREWDQSAYLSTVAGALVDITRAPEHGTLWAAYVLAGSADTLHWRRSFNNAQTWEDGTIFTGGTNSSVNINWIENKLVACWYNGSAIVQAISTDLGTTWGAPAAMSITGTNPRHLVDLEAGMSFYFYIDAGDLKLQRSGTLGNAFVDAAPITVATAIGAQTVAAQVTNDRQIVVGYILAGAWAQKISSNYGLSFS